MDWTSKPGCSVSKWVCDILQPMDIFCHYSQLVDPKTLKPSPKNPNRHDSNQIERLAKIIEAIGWRAPIVVSKASGFVVTGHARLEAALLKGWDRVPVSEQSYKDLDEEYAHMVADNAIAHWSELDLASVNLELANLDGMNFDIDVLGIKDFKLDLSEMDIEVKEQGLGSEPNTTQCPNCGHLIK